VLLSAQTPAPLASSTPVVTVAILDLRERGVDPKVVSALLDVAAEELGRVPGHKVLTRKEIEAILNEEARQQLVGCDSSSCLAEVAGALAADLLVSGEVARLGEGTLLTLQLINQRFATVMNRVSLGWPGPLEGLPDVVRAACQLLVVEARSRAPGVLEVVGVPGGASLVLDGKPLPGPRATGLEVGVHRLRVTAPGYEGREVPFVTTNGSTARVDGSLRKVPLHRKPLFWVSTATTGVLVTTVTAALVAAVVGGIPLVTLLVLRGGTTVRVAHRAPGTGGTS
jgi:hypothetical protein